MSVVDRLRTVGVLLVAAAIGGCNGSDDPLRMVGTLERDRVEIVAEAAEPIVVVEVREGDRVTAGQVLLKQETVMATARAEQAQAQIAEARQRVMELERGERPEVIQEVRARVAAARAAVDRDEREFERAQELVTQRLIAQSRLDEARAARDRSRALLREAQAQLAALLNGTRAEQIAQARAALSAAEFARKQLDVSEARLVVRATRDGVVEALPYELGERPPAGSPVVILLADTAPYARIYVPEPQRVNVQPGTAARVYVDGREAPLEGKVRFVASGATFTPYYALTQKDRSRLAFLAEVELTDPEARLMPAGVPVEVEVVEPSRG